MTFEEAIRGTKAPKEIIETLALLEVPFVSFLGEEKVGQLVVHKEVVSDLEKIFKALFELRFPIEKMVPIVAYDWDDLASMADNNSSAFNYRGIMGTDRLSNHSLGRAVDINTFQNPYFARDGKTYPEGAVYDPKARGAISADGLVVSIFKEHGWTWGGDWTSVKDWQHFEKLV